MMPFKCTAMRLLWVSISFLCAFLSHQLLDLGNVRGLGVFLAHSLLRVPRVPLRLALQIQHTGTAWNYLKIGNGKKREFISNYSSVVDCPLTRSLEYFLVAATETVAVQWNNAPDLLVVREEKQNENNKVKWKWMERDFFGSLEREIPSLWISLF